MAWPTAHRNGGALARQGGGFQTRGFQPRSTPYSPIRTPLGPPPVPGNDNLPWRPPPPAGLPFGKRGGGGGKGGGGGFRRYVRRNKWMRRLIRWNPVLDYIWDWYNYINPEPVANQRPDNTGWVLELYCGPSTVANIGSGGASCAPPTYVNVTVKPAPYMRYWWWVDWNRQHPVFPDIYVGQFQQRWRRVTGTVSASKKFPQEWYAPQKHPRPKPYFYGRVDPFAVPPGFWQPNPEPAPRAVSRFQWSTETEGNWSVRGYPSLPPKRPVTNSYEPTEKGTKERKTKVRRAAVFALKQAYMATEAVDAINALHDGVGGMPAALPAQYRSKSDRIQDKAQALYRHWDKIDVEQAVLNLAANQFLDLLVGVPQGTANQWATQHGITTGGALTGVRGI